MPHHTQTIHPEGVTLASRPRQPLLFALLLAALLLGAGQGCATIRVTDPPRTATELFLLSTAASEAISQLSADPLRDRLVWVETQFLSDTRETSVELSFLVGELRARLLQSGVRPVEKRDQAEIVLEVRSGGVGVDRLEFLLGIPATYLSGFTTDVGAGGVPITTPELALLKSTRQMGFASVAFVAYVAKTGELIAASGPFVGRTRREDFWILGTGPRTTGDIAPVERERRQAAPPAASQQQQQAPATTQPAAP
jgi:hypothetical protein